MTTFHKSVAFVSPNMTDPNQSRSKVLPVTWREL